MTRLPDGVAGVSWLNGRNLRFDTTYRTWREVPSTVLPEDFKNNGYEMIFDPKRSGYWLLLWRDLSFIKGGRVEQRLTLPKNFEKSSKALNERPLAQSAFCDKDGTIWLIHEGSLYRISPPNQQGETLSIETLFDAKAEKHSFTKLLSDKKGSIFGATNGFGIVHIIPKNNYFSHRVKEHSCKEFSEWNNDTLLVVANNDYLYSVLPSDKMNMPSIKVAPNTSFTVIMKTTDGRLLLREKDQQNPKKYIKIAYPNGTIENLLMPIASITDRNDIVFEDKYERIWVASSSGELACLPKGAKTMHYYDLRRLWQNKGSNYIPKQIYQSKNGVIWIPTFQGLLEMTVPEGNEPKFKLWQHNPADTRSLSSDALLCVLDDPREPDRYLWVSTSGEGINKMDKQTGQCRHFTQEDGLPNNVVYGILNDTQGRLWISTNYGLSCFNPTTLHFWNFTVDDGLQNNEFNTRSYYKFSDGRMGFGGVNGLSIFHPDKIQPDKTYPPLFFTELRINNKVISLRDKSGILREPIEVVKKIRLAYNQNFISISYAALNFVNRGNNVFYYKMDGVDPDWVFAGKRTEVNYPNLSPGTYTLHVTNVNDNGEKNPSEKTISFVISPPWWRSWAAYLVYALLLGFAAWRTYQFQLNRLKLQNELVYKEKEAKNLQALDELKTHFFTNITHEFRTPLTLILEPARQVGNTTDAKILKKQSSIILNNANRLLMLVNQLLDISKLEDNKLQVHWSEGDLLLIIRDLVEWFEPSMQKKNQTLLLHTDMVELEGVTDRQILEKIVYNLLSNAHKFTPENGNIRLTIAQPNPDIWQIIVQDTGTGIAADKLPHIFDRFYQADNTLTRRNEGTGIGLALVKELCKLLDATIDVESTIGVGTKFTLTFPTRPNTEGGSIKAQNASVLPENPIVPSPFVEAIPVGADEGQQTVLLVEDNAEMREYLNLILTQNGYAVLEAENGRLGVAKALELVPDLIITDLMMPEMNGYELTQSLKNNPITSHIPIMILTAKGRQENKIEGYRRGADAYLPKPFNTEEVLVRLSQLLEVQRKMQRKYQDAQLALPNAVHDTESVSEEVPPSEGINNPSNLGISDIDNEWLQNLTSLIKEKMGTDTFAQDDLPTLMLMSRTQFYSKVKALTGLTPAMMVRNMRLDTAYQRLATEAKLTVRDVSFDVGINDVKHFTTLFKERFGTTPKQVAMKGASA